MKFREHRGSLDDSLLTVVELKDRFALLEHLTSILHRPVTEKDVAIVPYTFDSRIGWQTYIVTLPGYGVIGFTDSSV
jgi:hypothetical protein